MTNQITGIIEQGIQYAADAIPALLNSAAEQTGSFVKENPLPAAITAILGLGSLFYLYKNSHSQRLARAESQLIPANMGRIDKLFVIKALAKVPPKNLQNVVAHAHTFITNNIRGTQTARVIEALAHVPPENLQNVVAHAHTFITNNMDGYDNACIIEALAKIPPENLQNVVAHSHTFITNNMNGMQKARVIEALAHVPPESLVNVVAHAHTFITNNMNGYEKSWIIEVLAQVPPENLQTFVGHAHSFITDNMDKRDKTRIIKALAKVPPENLQDFVDHANSFITDNMDGYDNACIIEALAHVPPENLQNFVDHANSFIAANMGTIEKHWVIEALAKVPPENLQNFVDHANSFITDNMDGHDNARIIKALAKVPPENLQDFVDRANSFITDNMDGKQKARVIEALAHVPPESLANVVAHAHTFITNNMDGHDNACIITALAQVPPENLQDFVDQAFRIITENTENRFKAEILSLFSRLALRTNLNNFITQLLPLSNNMNEFEKPFFFVLISAHVTNRQDGMNIDLGIQELLPFINHNNKIQKLLMMVGLKFTDNARRAEIFEQFQLINEDERNHRMQRAVEQPLMQNLAELIAQANLTIIYAFARNHETALQNTFFACLTTPANAELPAAPAHVVEVIEEVLNVHENNRDQKTRQAYELLQAHFQDAAIDIEANVAACLEYLGDPVIANLHRHVLDGPNSPSDFGPFITAEPFVISDLEVDGREATALLWAYIQEIQNEVDKETALLSLKGALTRCMNNDGERICNQGKLQQLCVAVLQGSLPGVQIDDPVEQQAIPTAHAMNLFFATPANQAHANWAALEAAAQTFLDHNPLVDGQEFMAEILEFATLQGIAGVPAPAQ